MTHILGPDPEPRQSRWLWWVYLGIGMLSCVGFVIVAVKVQSRRFARAAAISVALSIVALAAAELWPPSADTNQAADSDASGSLSTLNGGWVVVAVWACLVVYGHVLNHSYKEFLRRKDEQEYLQRHAINAQARSFYVQQAPPHPSAAAQSRESSTDRRPPPPWTHAPTQPSPGTRRPSDASVTEADRFLAWQPSGNVPAATPPNAPMG